MKVRSGFVSNSSSSSFCILGVTSSQINNDLEVKIDFEGEYLYSKLKDFKLEYECGINDYYENYVIGIAPYNIPEDKTIKEAKQDVLNNINKCFETNLQIKDIGFHIDGERN